MTFAAYPARGAGVTDGQKPALLYDEDGVTLAAGHYLYTLAQTYYVTGGAIGAAGADYVPGNIATLAGGGFGHGSQARFSIDAVDGGGGATAITLVASGSYSNLPGANPGTVTGGAGTGLTIAFTSTPGFSASHDYHLPLTSSFGEGLLLVNDPLSMLNSGPAAAVIDFLPTAPDTLAGLGPLFGISFGGGSMLLASDDAGHWNTVGQFPLDFGSIPNFTDQNLFTIGAGVGPTQVQAGHQLTGIAGNAPFTMNQLLCNLMKVATSAGGAVGVINDVTTGNNVIVVSNAAGVNLVSIGDPGVIGGAALPTVNPHVRNALWNNLGIVTVSAG